jgi:hypothetical protein
MSSVLVLHILAVGIWLGCLATEIFFEKLMERDESARLFVSLLHDRVDRFVEGPAFVATGLTGFVLALDAAWTPVLIAKVGFGLAAILLNVWCVKIVVDRAVAAREGRWTDWAGIDRSQHKVGGLVAVLLIAATVTAIARVV